MTNSNIQGKMVLEKRGLLPCVSSTCSTGTRVVEITRKVDNIQHPGGIEGKRERGWCSRKEDFHVLKDTRDTHTGYCSGDYKKIQLLFVCFNQPVSPARSLDILCGVWCVCTLLRQAVDLFYECAIFGFC